MLCAEATFTENASPHDHVEPPLGELGKLAYESECFIAAALCDHISGIKFISLTPSAYAHTHPNDDDNGEGATVNGRRQTNSFQ